MSLAWTRPAALAVGLLIGACSGSADEGSKASDQEEGGDDDDSSGSSAPAPRSTAGKDAGAPRSASAPAPQIGEDSPEPPLSSHAQVSDAGVVIAQPAPTVRAPAVVSPFIDTRKDPFSTFGADVDTASYDYLRQSLQTYDRLPAPEYVRVEDYVNFFKYTYPIPPPESATPFSISLAGAAHPLGRATTLLRVGIQAKAAPAEKKPINLVFLVDVSGSMASSDKLPLVQRVITEALSVLQPTDKVSVVSYASDTRVRLMPTPVSSRAEITAVVDQLIAGGGTNGASGIDLAYQQASAGFIQGGINHVILCTDGDFNLGVTSSEALVSLIQQKRATGVTLTALGFGHDNLNDAMMERVSNAGNGTYSIVYSVDQAISYSNKRLISTVVHVAKDVKLQVEFNPSLVSAYRLVGYEDRAIADTDFLNDSVDGGEIGAEHRVTALYELVLEGQPLPSGAGIPALSSGEASDLVREVGANELVRVKVRAKAPGATDADPASEVSQALTSADLAQPSSADFRWAAAVASFAEILRVSPYVKPQELDEVIRIVQADDTNDVDRLELRSLIQSAKPKLAQPSQPPP